MTLTFIGHGYVGLVTGAVFADLGNTVWMVGRTPEKIANLKKGKIPFFEPGLEELVKRNIAHGRLKFTLDYGEAISPSEIIFLCVGTPSRQDGQADLSSVFAAAKNIAKVMHTHKLIVIKSTVPPGTNKNVAKIIREELPKQVIFDIASCPEFLREGTAIADTLSPDRIVIGAETEEAKKLLIDLHRPIDGKIVITNIETAEMTKYVANALLSTKISFANAIAFLCEEVGADVVKVMDGVGLDKRIGRSFLSPGVGYGGSCFPKDVKALIAFAQEKGYDFKLLKSVDEINQDANLRFIQEVRRSYPEGLENKKVAVWGLAFKPNTDDMREAPSVKIISALQHDGAKIYAYDPVAEKNASAILSDVSYTQDAYDAVKNADVLIILTEWNEFLQIDLKKVKKLMKQPIIIDGRNIYDPAKIKRLGFVYKSVGRS